MKKDLNISRPKSDEFEYIDYPTNYKPLGPNEGRVGYYQTVKEGEEKRHKPVFEVGTFNGVINEFTTDFSPIPLESL